MATTKIYTLSLHDALPIFKKWLFLAGGNCKNNCHKISLKWPERLTQMPPKTLRKCSHPITNTMKGIRSEEHTSELQSHSDLVCRLLLEKKKKKLRRLTLLT